MNAQGFFSVIIPAYNRKSFLKKAVDSVLAQTFPSFELVIIDDGSTDGTHELVLSYDDDRVRYFYGQNRGVAYARNRGIENAKGSFIAFLDSDDWWDVKKLEVAREYIDRYPGTAIFHTDEIWYRKGKLLDQKQKHAKPSGSVYEKALPLCCISISTAVISKKLFPKVGMFDETFQACEDYDFWLRATSRHEVKLIPEELTLKDGGRPDQLSSSVWGLDRFRIKALEKMLSCGKLTKKQYRLTLDELSRKCGVFALGAEKRGKSGEAAYYRGIPAAYS